MDAFEAVHALPCSRAMLRGRCILKYGSVSESTLLHRRATFSSSAALFHVVCEMPLLPVCGGDGWPAGGGCCFKKFCAALDIETTAPAPRVALLPCVRSNLALMLLDTAEYGLSTRSVHSNTRCSKSSQSG